MHDLKRAHNLDSPLREVLSLDGLVQYPGTIVRVFTGQSGRFGGAEGLSNRRSLVGSSHQKGAHTLT
jgi:hypothetical protein